VLCTLHSGYCVLCRLALVAIELRAGCIAIFPRIKYTFLNGFATALP